MTSYLNCCHVRQLLSAVHLCSFVSIASNTKYLCMIWYHNVLHALCVPLRYCTATHNICHFQDS